LGVVDEEEVVDRVLHLRRASGQVGVEESLEPDGVLGGTRSPLLLRQHSHASTVLAPGGWPNTGSSGSGARVQECVLPDSPPGKNPCTASSRASSTSSVSPTRTP